MASRATGRAPRAAVEQGPCIGRVAHDGLLGRLQAGGVLVLSLEVAAPTGAGVHRRGRWHMISVFKGGGADAQPAIRPKASNMKAMVNFVRCCVDAAIGSALQWFFQTTDCSRL